MKKLLATIFILSITISCGDDDNSSSNPSATVSTSTGNQYLDENIILPPGSFKVSEDSILMDPSISITSNTNDTSIISGGENMTDNIDFTAQNSNVTHAGIRFGATGPITMVPISGAVGNQVGTLSFPTQIPSLICTDIAKICHDVKCYEFAVAQTNDGKFRVSAANINQLVASCGACDLPSCKSLISEPCDNGGGGDISSLSVDGVAKNAEYTSCFNVTGPPNQFIMAAQDGFNNHTYELSLLVEQRPISTKTYSTVEYLDYQNSSDEIEISYSLNGGNFESYSSDVGGTVKVVVEGSKLKYQFNDITLNEFGSNKTITISGEIICE